MNAYDLQDAAIERYVLDDLNGVRSLEGGNVVLDFVDPDGTGSQPVALSKRYLYGNAVDQILAQEDVTQTIGSPDRVFWLLADNLGTVRDVAKNDAAMATHYKYDSFGRVTLGDTSLTRYLFTSRELDNVTALQYSRARWYDSITGRWLTIDPIGFTAGDANTTRYVNNAPASHIDPTGLIKPGGGHHKVPQQFWPLFSDDVQKIFADEMGRTGRIQNKYSVVSG